MAVLAERLILCKLFAESLAVCSALITKIVGVFVFYVVIVLTV